VRGETSAMATMADVAAEAGVSRATVSVVLNGRAGQIGIALATRERVQAAAQRLGYRVDDLSRALAAGRNPQLCLVVGSWTHEATPDCLAAVLAAAEQAGRVMQVVAPAQAAAVLASRPAGVLGWALAGERRGWLTAEAARLGLPVALVEPAGTDGLRPAVEHLFELGHRHLGLLALPCDEVLEAGFRQGVAGHWLPLPDAAILRLEEEPDAARERVRDWLKPRRMRPSAVCCTSDAAALVVLRVARRLDLKVPRDLSVVGYGATRLGAWADPPLTSVEPPVAVWAAEAVRRVLGIGVGVAEETAPRLIERRSTAAV